MSSFGNYLLANQPVDLDLVQKRAEQGENTSETTQSMTIGQEDPDTYWSPSPANPSLRVYPGQERQPSRLVRNLSRSIPLFPRSHDQEQNANPPVPPVASRQQSLEQDQPMRAHLVQNRQTTASDAIPSASQNVRRGFLASHHKLEAPLATGVEFTTTLKMVQSRMNRATDKNQHAPADAVAPNELVEQILEALLGNPVVACGLALDIVGKLDFGSQVRLWRQRFVEMDQDQQRKILWVIQNEHAQVKSNRPLPDL